MTKQKIKPQNQIGIDHLLNEAGVIEEAACEPATFETHEATAIFPDMSAGEFEELKVDIRANGQKMPILIFRNKIIDGRQRLRACQELGIPPKLEAVSDVGGSVASYIVSLNLKRRHLNESQRAMVANQMANLGLGANQHTAEAVPQAKAAKLLAVSVDSVQRAKSVTKRGVAELVKAVEDGAIDVTNASTIATLPHDEQSVLLGLDSKLILNRAKEIRKAAMADRRKVRIESIERKRANNKPLDPSTGPFNVIYADPPWDYMSEETVGYPTMPLDQIAAMPVDKLASEDAVLFMWCSASLIGDALKIVEAWGFKYKTQAIWDKQRGGQGAYFRVQHEVLLLATRGVVPEVPYSAREGSVFTSYVGSHSEKPERCRDTIDGMYPELSKIELFCRGTPKKGWAGWGNECIETISEQKDIAIVASPLLPAVSDVRTYASASNDDEITMAIERLMAA